MLFIVRNMYLVQVILIQTKKLITPGFRIIEILPEYYEFAFTRIRNTAINGMEFTY